MTPHHGAIDFLQRSWQSQIRQWFRITRFQTDGVKDIVFTIDEEDYFLVRAFIHGIDVIDARRQVK